MLSHFELPFLCLLTVFTYGKCSSSKDSEYSSSSYSSNDEGVEGSEKESKPIYNEELAETLLKLSAGAYAVSPDECVDRIFPDENWIKYSSGSVKCDDLGNLCSYYSIYSDERKQIVVVFRGTRGKEQLLSEAMAAMSPGVPFYTIGKINEYFFNGIDKLWNYGVEKLLSDEKLKEYKVAFTGHSLGGALAALGAVKTALEKLRHKNEIILYTFGEPRVGNARFALNFDRLVPTSFRVINAADIVPHLPPCSNNMINQMSAPCDPKHSGSFHHSTEIWYPNGMSKRGRSKYRVCSPNEDFSCSDSLTFHIFKADAYFENHRHYFGHKVPAFGKLGCVVGNPREETLPNDAITANDPPPTSIFGTIKNSLSKLFKL